MTDQEPSPSGTPRPDEPAPASWAPPAYGTPPAYGYPSPAPVGPGGYPPASGYGTPPGHPGGGLPPRFRSNAALGTALQVLGAVMVLGDVLSAVTAPAAVAAYDAAIAQGGTSDVLTLHDGVGALALVTLPTWIVGSLWLTRVHANAGDIEPGGLRRSQVWCWLGWFVPIVSLWFPKQIVDDGHRITAGALRHPTSATRPRSTNGWWAAWLVYNVLGNFAGRASLSSTDPHHGVIPGLEAVVAFAGLVAFVLWVPVLRAVTQTQTELVAQQGPARW